ncbi:MAG: DNA-binding protein [Thermoproteota archaeon]
MLTSRAKCTTRKLEDFKKAYKIQEKLYQIGNMKNFADLLIATICINKAENLVTKETDFKSIAEASDLEVEILK